MRRAEPPRFGAPLSTTYATGCIWAGFTLNVQTAKGRGRHLRHIRQEQVMTEQRSKPLAGRTMIMSGGSRGIGLEIAKRAAGGRANITLIAKTAQPHPKLPGTIHTAAAEIEASGGQALPFVGD